MHRFLFLIFILVSGLSVFSQDNRSHEVYFEHDTSVVSNTERNRLFLFISTLRLETIASISIYGFCDDTGTDSYNLSLSQERADTIKAIFNDTKIKASLMTNVDGKGKVLLKTMEQKDIIKARGLNRKVEIIVKQKTRIPKKEKPVIKEKSVVDLIKEASKGDKIHFKHILFEVGYARVTPESIDVLDRIVAALLERKDLYFTIQGHVCCTLYTRDAIDQKTKKRNLSESRAKYVYDYFAKKGVNKKHMRYVGLRRKFPLGSDPKFDRRVEIFITYAHQESQ